jgi:hypothetical protein
MPRILVALVGLLALMSTTSGATPPVPAAAVHSVLFTSVPTDDNLLRLRTLADSARSTPVTLTCCKVWLRRQGLREYLNVLAPTQPKATGSPRNPFQK